jgi:hypothetical protein
MKKLTYEDREIIQLVPPPAGMKAWYYGEVPGELIEGKVDYLAVVCVTKRHCYGSTQPSGTPIGRPTNEIDGVELDGDGVHYLIGEAENFAGFTRPDTEEDAKFNFLKYGYSVRWAKVKAAKESPQEPV